MATPLVWLLLRLSGQRLKIESKLRPAAVWAAFLFLVHFVVQNVGLTLTSATNTAWLVAVSPLAMAVLAALILREHPGRSTWIGIVVAFVGVLLLVSQGRIMDLDWLSSTGDWLALGSAFTWALYTIATRDLARAHPPMVVTAAMLVPCLLTWAPGCSLRPICRCTCRFPARRWWPSCFWASWAWGWVTGCGLPEWPGWEPQGPACFSTWNRWPPRHWPCPI